jgi:hypothetical protein
MNESTEYLRGWKEGRLALLHGLIQLLQEHSLIIDEVAESMRGQSKEGE